MKGKHAPVQKSVIIGRGPGTLSLSDSKISGKHAEIVPNADGGWRLKDLGSTNGILLDGKKVPALDLLPGTTFTLGQTLLTVELVAEKVPEMPPRPEPPKEAHWSEFFAEFIQKTSEKVKSRPRKVEAFQNVLRLRWLRGVQIEWDWYIGYGPREFGAGSIDFPIYDENAMDLSFRIKPSPSGPLLECAKGNTVLLNKKPVTAEVLNHGDLIAFGDSLIEVNFVKEK
jgi:pSer/pThr/pTyr-binding forkhead associated (FHA) protein